MVCRATPSGGPPAIELVRDPGILDSSGYGTSCRRCADAHSRRNTRRDRPVPRYGTVRSQSSHGAARWTATRRGGRDKPRRGGGRYPPPRVPRETPPVAQTGTASGGTGGEQLSASSGLAVAQTLLVAIRRYSAVVHRLL